MSPARDIGNGCEASVHEHLKRTDPDMEGLPLLEGLCTIDHYPVERLGFDADVQNSVDPALLVLPERVNLWSAVRVREFR